MKTDIGFPSLGTLAKFLFEATGLLPEKGARKESRFSDAERIALQKSLQRLVIEEGHFEKNFDDVLTIFRDQVQQIIPSKKVVEVIFSTIDDVYVQYRHLLNDEGTYFSQKKTLKWALDTRLLSRLVLSPHKHALRQNLQSERWLTPDDVFWYLPSVAENKVVWPLTKVLEWAYQVADTSSTHFHYPGKNSDQENAQLQQNETNARNWRNGTHMPSWRGLSSNIKQSLDAMESCTSVSHRSLSSHQQESIYTLSFIARFTTYLCQKIEAAYGRDFLIVLIERYKQYSQHLSLDHSIVLKQVDAEVEKAWQSGTATTDFRDQLLLEAIPSFWAQVTQQGQFFLERLEARKASEGLYNRTYTEQEQGALKLAYGMMMGQWLIDSHKIQNQYPASADFFEQLNQAERLRKTREIKKDAIQAFEQRLKQKSLTEAMGWYVNWLYGIMYYRKKSYSQAHFFYEKAFQHAKYSAGNLQYRLVNEYIELCAKNKKKKHFKKAVSWAHYIGMRVRWIEGEHPTEEALDVAYTIHQHGFYPQT